MRRLALPVLLFTLVGQGGGWAAQPTRYPTLPVAASVRPEADPAAYCEVAVTTAEAAGRLPPRLLHAISLTESGRIDPRSGRFRAWPWTINAEGRGQFFATSQAAVAAAKGLWARGVRSIDVGCLQVNLMYHPAAFTSFEEAFDPWANARYAARFLNALYAEGKGWPHAIASYHSDTPMLGEPYRALVMARWLNADPKSAVRAELPGQSQYRAFTRDDGAYAAFAPRSRVYGAFAPR